MEEVDELVSLLAEMEKARPDPYQQIALLTAENKKLKALRKTFNESANDVVNQFNEEKNKRVQFQMENEQMKLELVALRTEKGDLEKGNLNNIFTKDQEINELCNNNREEHNDYVELSKDYLYLLSDITCYYNYEIRKERKRILSKTEKFLSKTLGKFHKPKVILSKFIKKETDSISQTSSRASKRSSSQKEAIAKRLKTELWDVKSISQATSPSSPAVTIPYHDEEDAMSWRDIENESSCSFNTFSIGNETTFSSLRKINIKKEVCACMKNEVPALVSTGTNTEEPLEIQPSVQSLLDNYEDVPLVDSIEPESNWQCVPSLLNEDEESPPPPAKKKMLSKKPSIVVKTRTSSRLAAKRNPSIAMDEVTIDEEGEKEVTALDKSTEIQSVVENNQDEVEDALTSTATDMPQLPELSHVEPIVDSATILKNDLRLSDSEDEFEIVKCSEIGTNTEATTETIDRCSSPITMTQTSNKATSTVHSTTTRGTMTAGCQQKSIGVQCQDTDIEQILFETMFEMPELIDPINDFDDEPIQQVQPKKMLSQETMTEMENINRQIDYVVVDGIIRIKQEKSAEQHSFANLGQTLFELLLQRLQRSGMDHMEGREVTREFVWRRLKQQLLNRFCDLIIDEPTELLLEQDYSSAGKERIESYCLDSDAEIVEINLEPAKPVEPMIAEPMILETVIEKPVEAIVEPMIEEPAIEKPVESVVEPMIEEPAIEKIVEAIVEPMIEEPAVEKPVKEVSSIVVEAPQEETSASEIEEVVAQVKTTEEPLSEEDESFEEILQKMRSICSSPPSVIAPIRELDVVVWDSLFPPEQVIELDGPSDSADVLEGFCIEHEAIEIPMECLNQPEDDEVTEIVQSNFIQYSENETPKSPPPFCLASQSADASTEIPCDSAQTSKNFFLRTNSVLQFNPPMRDRLVNWQLQHSISSKIGEKRLCKTRKIIKTYMEAEWTSENLEICLEAISDKHELIIAEAIYETVEDSKMEQDVCTLYTPPAPPLPPYLQKLTLLVVKLHKLNSRLPGVLVSELEEKLFKLNNNTSLDLDHLRNISYYYSALVDQFFEGDTSMVFHFIFKIVYFFGYKSVPMVFVLIKAFPTVLPKKSTLLKKYSKNVDWENMTGLEMSKIRLDLEWMDSLDLTMMFLLTNTLSFSNKKHESYEMATHELFSYLPKFYGFPLNFTNAYKLLDMLMKRIEDNQLHNMSFSLILLAKRSHTDFAIKTMLKGKMIPLLNTYAAELIEKAQDGRTKQVCMLIEAISCILKPMTEEEKTFKTVFSILMSIFGRCQQQCVQEYCIKAILRLQRFMDNHKEIYGILQQWLERIEVEIDDSLKYSIQTFVHRKNANFFN